MALLRLNNYVFLTEEGFVEAPQDLSFVYPDLAWPRGYSWISGHKRVSSEVLIRMKQEGLNAGKTQLAQAFLLVECDEALSKKRGLKDEAGMLDLSEVDSIGLSSCSSKVGAIVDDLWAQHVKQHGLVDEEKGSFRRGFTDPLFIDTLRASHHFAHINIITMRLIVDNDVVLICSFTNRQAVSELICEGRELRLP